MAEIASDVVAWLGKFLDSGKKRVEMQRQTSASSVAPASGPATGAAGPAGSALAGQLRTAMAAGGINIAIYLIGDPDKNNDKEFKRQADVWAGNHGAFGVAGATVKKDYAMSLSDDPGKLVTNLLAAIQKELKTQETIPIANLALFAHGGATSAKIHSKGAGGGEGWAGAHSKVVEDLAAAVKPALTAGAKIHLFACNTAMDLEAKKAKDEAEKAKKAKKAGVPYVPKGADDSARLDSFAEDLQEMTGAEVWGHEDARHTTGNPELVEVTDTNEDANAERYQLRDVLARKFLVHVDASLTEPQMGYLDKTLKISKWINGCMQFKGSGFTQTDNYQIFIEEISMMGYDRLFDLMIASSPPDAATFRSLFPEHDQIDKLTAGAAAVHARFHKEMDEKTEAVAAAKTKPGFPSSVSP